MSGLTSLKTTLSRRKSSVLKTTKEKRFFRVRVGDQRILYVVRYNPNKLLVVRVDKRSRVYR